MPITTKQETILAYINDTLLPTINGTGNFNLTLASDNIVRGKWFHDKFGDFPAICIIDELGSDLIDAYTSGWLTTGNDAGSIYDAWKVELLGYVKADSDNLGKGFVQTEINKLYSDLMIAIYADRDLGGNALTCSVIRFEKEDSMGDGNIGALVLTLAIKIDFNPSASPPVT